jgi:chemotaxis protein methyltransferase CheR
MLGAAQDSAATFKAWCAVCASGEEAYSLAILLEREGIPSRILGTDISRDALRTAEKGHYHQWSLRGAAAQMLKADASDGTQFQVPGRVRSRVAFAHLNLADEDYGPSRLDLHGMNLIMCRNVLMYLEEPVVRRVANNLCSRLAPNGWLVIGPSDPLLIDVAPLEAIITDAGILYRKSGPISARAPVSQTKEPVQPERHVAEPRAQSIRRPVALSPKNPKPAPLDVATLRALADRGDIAAVLRSVECAIAADPSSTELYFVKSIALLAAGQHGDATRALRSLLYLDPDAVMAHFLLATSLERGGDRAGALRAYARVVSVCASLPADDPLPLSDGETAPALARACQDRIHRLQDAHR